LIDYESEFLRFLSDFRFTFYSIFWVLYLTPINLQLITNENIQDHINTQYISIYSSLLKSITKNKISSPEISDKNLLNIQAFKNNKSIISFIKYLLTFDNH
jgi:hypothetical protein